MPFLPELVSPSLNFIVQDMSTLLSWIANDVDNDPLLFDVYFDTVNPPVSMVSENQSELSFEVNLNSSTDYYWKVVVKDTHGGITNGQVWNFITD